MHIFKTFMFSSVPLIYMFLFPYHVVFIIQTLLYSLKSGVMIDLKLLLLLLLLFTIVLSCIFGFLYETENCPSEVCKKIMLEF